MRGVSLSHLVKGLLLALIAVVLYGSVPKGQVITLLGLFVALRVLALGGESLRRMPDGRHWEQLAQTLERKYAEMGEAERAMVAAGMGLPINSFPRAMAAAAVDGAMQPYQNVRSLSLVFADALGMATYVLLFPLIVAIYANDFVSLRRSEGWIGIGVALIGIGLYAWPHCWPKSAQSSRRKKLWWALPFLPAVWFACSGIVIRHPYLNPFNPERVRLAAERILALPDGVVAASHADWVLDYAWLLHHEGDNAQAAEFCRMALRLDAGSAEAAELWRTLTQPLPPGSPASGPEVSPQAPYWSSRESIPQAPRIVLGSAFDVDEHTVIIVPVGDVPSDLLDSVAWVVQQELAIPCVVTTSSVPLPVHSRVRGILFGKQWDCRSIAMAFERMNQPPPNGPFRYLLVTSADLYAGDSNFVFATTASCGAIASYARLGSAGSNVLHHRLAKLCLGSVIRSFAIPPSHDRACVTSYTRSIPEFDGKGNRPTRATLATLRAYLDMANPRWLSYKQQKRAARP